jgi:hypothetical protein
LYSSGGGPTVAGSFGIYNNSTSTNALILSASNNLGLGMAPTTNNISKSISLVNGGSIFGYGSGTYITANSNYNGAWNTVATGPDSRILLDGNVVFSRSASATAGSAGAVSESMRIDTSGNLLVGATSGDAWLATSGKYAQLGGTFPLAATNSSLVGIFNRTGTDGDLLEFKKDASVVGSISVTATTTTYNTTSDQRLKENITDAPAGNVDDIKVRSFDWKADGSHQDYGMVAQELEAVAPYAVTKGETEDDMWSVDYSKLVPMLIKEIQDLKAEVAALKGAN